MGSKLLGPLVLGYAILASLQRGCLCEQRFLETPAIYQEVSSGEDIQLRCTVEDQRGQCIWQKDRKPVGVHRDKYEFLAGGIRDNDCTLVIRRASLDFDDGYWECQVTPGDFTRQDALTSSPARLLVRVKPRDPKLEIEGTSLNSALTLREGQETTVSCVSRYGNPPALIKWYIGDNEVTSVKEQTNATEVDNPKTWAAHSSLKIRGKREIHGLPVKCISFHPSSPTPSVAEITLDVQYSPEVKLETSPRILTTSLEDSTSFMSLKCIADANPSPMIKWFKDSVPITAPNNNIVTPLLVKNRTLQQSLRNGTLWSAELRFEPVKRDDVGHYSCKAVNDIGESPPANYRLDVQYGPKLKIKDSTVFNDTTIEREESALLGSTLERFECAEFEANPPAQYRWIHLRGGITENIENRARNENSGRKLRLENIMWADEGEYRCVAYNVINGVQREMQSEQHFLLHVTGPPEIQTRPYSSESGVYESLSWSGEPVHKLKSRFCSRPPPRLVAWQWGSSHLRAGDSIPPKYEALPLEPIIENKMVTNCYWAKLHIKNVQQEDARIYTLVVESEKGRDSTNIKLVVRDATEMRVIAAAAAVGLLFLLLIISIGVYSLLKVKHRRYQQEVEEEGSIAADAFYNTAAIDRQKTSNNSTPIGSKSFVRKSSQDGGLAVLYDYDQIGKQSRNMSPEALKVRRAPAVVLQPPTIV